jgi:hypothetical protein
VYGVHPPPDVEELFPDVDEVSPEVVEPPDVVEDPLDVDVVEEPPDVVDEVSHVSPVRSVQVPLTHSSQVSMPLAFGHCSQLIQSPSVQPPPEVEEPPDVVDVVEELVDVDEVSAQG